MNKKIPREVNKFSYGYGDLSVKEVRNNYRQLYFRAMLAAQGLSAMTPVIQAVPISPPVYISRNNPMDQILAEGSAITKISPAVIERTEELIFQEIEKEKLYEIFAECGSDATGELITYLEAITSLRGGGLKETTAKVTVTATVAYILLNNPWLTDALLNSAKIASRAPATSNGNFRAAAG